MYKNSSENQTRIIDAPMGAGKTQAAINFINGSSSEKRFIYVTPYLTEVERIIQSCPDRNFVEPERLNKQTPKILDLKHKLKKGANIATTHAMFRFFDDYIMDLCASENYTLILDEVADVIHELDNIKKADLENLWKNYFEVNENGIIRWKNECSDYPSFGSRFSDIKRLVDLGSLADYGSGARLLWLFPAKVFRSFKETYVLTYMFEAQLQRYYYDMCGIHYKYAYVAGDNVDNYHLTDTPQEYNTRYNYRELINIVDEPKLNAIGNGDTALSKNWYESDKKSGGEQLKKLRNNAINFFKHKKVLYQDGEYVTSSSKHNIWTTFSDYKSMLGKGGTFSKGFIPCNARATNEYKERTVVAYLINRFSNRNVFNFFAKQGIKIDDDAYALSEMLQFIWRSGIRDGKHITIYIPSKRMRNLLVKWINENSPQGCSPLVIESPSIAMKKRKMERIEDWEENA